MKRDLVGADAAFRRAARRALNLALRTGTACWIMRDGQMVDLAAEGRDRFRKTASGTKPRQQAILVSARKSTKKRPAGFDSIAAERAWQAFQRDLGITAIHTEREYARTVRLMNSLLDVVGGNERHPLAGLLHLVGELVWSYESRVLPLELLDGPHKR